MSLFTQQVQLHGFLNGHSLAYPRVAQKESVQVPSSLCDVPLPGSLQEHCAPP
jgi:hypothetical protein